MAGLRAAFYAAVSGKGDGYGPAQTLILQSDEAAGIDTFIFNGATTSNYGTDTRCIAGDLAGGGGNVARQLIKFDLSPIPAGSLIISATLSLYAITDSSNNARTYRVYRQKRVWLEGTRPGGIDSPATGATWIRYDLTNNWQTAGGFGSDDCEQTDIGSRSFTASETLNVFKDFVLDPAAVREMIAGGAWVNNGFLIKADTENFDAYEFASSDNTAAANRPKFTIVYRIHSYDIPPDVSAHSAPATIYVSG